jgi:Sulfotransferase domain/N-terminal domain of galactosyltransferase
MPASPRIAFVTTCKGRLPHLRETLPKNMWDNSTYPNAVYVVLGYEDPELDKYMRTFSLPILNGDLVYYRYENGGGPFHMAHAKNMAMRCAMLEGAEILVTVDADNFTNAGFAQFVADRIGDRGFFLCPNYRHIKSLPHGPERPKRGYAGRLAIRTQDFIKMGGYCETFSTWRGEDIDMIARMERIEFWRGHIENRHLDAIMHDSEVRFKEYPHAIQYETAGEWQAIYDRAETVVNFGRFGLGTVYRNFSTKPIEIKALPTRVFGIGMHKTGTTSLHHAFETLGLDSFHWGSNRKAYRIWNEMNTLGHSTMVEKQYALCDLPIPMLFKELDKAYPGSKFILTTLAEDAWLKSVQCLWNPNCNPSYDWDRQPFSHLIHEALYGTRYPTPEIFLARYRRHNAEVREYFKDRPQDLLQMPMSEGAGWAMLCTFLDKPIPNIPYPHAYKDPSNKHWIHAGDL